MLSRWFRGDTVVAMMKAGNGEIGRLQRGGEGCASMGESESEQIRDGVDKIFELFILDANRRHLGSGRHVAWQCLFPAFASGIHTHAQAHR